MMRFSNPVSTRLAAASVVLTSLFAGILLSACGQSDSNRQHSIAAVLASPQAFEGKVITVRGFVSISQNESAIYLSADDYRWGIQANGIWLHMPKCANRAKQGVSRGYMTVVGNFTAKLHGYADGWIGEIDNITQCRLIEGVDGDPRPRSVDP